MVDIMNPASYKACRKKQFEVWVCRPPIHTVVVDHLTQHRGSVILQNAGISENLILADVIHEWKSNGDRRFAVVRQALSNGLISVVSKPSQVVLCGTDGQYYVTEYDFVCMQYSVFSGGKYVSLDSIPRLRDKCFDWRRIRANSSYTSKTVACFVKLPQSFVFGTQIVNESGVEHGKGDFIVCNKLPDGQPDIRNGWVVNGLTFSDTYNNSGWQDCIVIGRHGDIEMPPSVIVREKSSSKSSISQLFYIPCIKKTAEVGKYRFSTQGYAMLIEQSGNQTRIRTSDGFVKTLDGDSDAVAAYLNKSRVYYKFMYRALVEQMQSEGMIDVLYGEFDGMLDNCRVDRQFFLLKELYKTFKRLGFKLSSLEFDDTSDEETRYVFEDGSATITTQCCVDSVHIYGWSKIESSDFYDDADPYEVDANWVDGGYKLFDTEFRKVYAVLSSPDSTVNKAAVYLQKFKDAGIDSSLVADMTDYFNSKQNSVALQRGYNIVLWAHKIGVLSSVDSYGNVLYLNVECESTMYKVFVEPRVLALEGEYIVGVENEDMTDRYVVYSDYNAFKRSLSSVKKADDSVSFLMNYVDKFFFFIGNGIIGFGDRQANVLMQMPFTRTRFGGLNIRTINSVFRTLYTRTKIPCYQHGEDMFDDLVKKAKVVSVDEFVLKLFSSLDRIASQAGYHIECLPERWVAEMDYTSPCFELVELSPSTGHAKGYVYNSWFNVKMPFSCSVSTWKAIEAWKGEFNCPVVGKSFDKLHYHQLQLRATNYMHLYDYKDLRLAYLRENERTFNGELSQFMRVSACNYNSIFKDDSDYGAAHYGWLKMIFVNAQYNKIQDLRSIPVRLRCVMIHEMCHELTEVRYGTCRENPGEDAGVVYGISPKYKDQWIYHGKHFGECVEFASRGSGLAFDEIYHYGYGHPVLYNTGLGSDNSVMATSASLAFDNGKPYRYYSSNPDSIFMCKVCGSVYSSQRACHSKQTVEVGYGRFVTRCKSCGDVVVYNEVTDLPIEMPGGYYSDIDIVGMLSTCKCKKCSGSLESIAPGLSREDRKEYSSDFKFANHYKEHFYAVASKILSKYNGWFNRVAKCNISMSCDVMPFILFSIKGEYFEEYYKLFFSAQKNSVISGALYRDYNNNSKGYRIHKFRLRTDTDIGKFMDYFMNFVRRDFKTT